MKFKMNINKININKINIVLILIFIVIIFLGIILVYKNYEKKNSIKEGLTAKETNALAKDLNATIDSKLKAAGIPTSSSPELEKVFDQLQELMTKEIAFNNENTESELYKDSNQPVENTVNLSPLMDTTFFKGVKFSDSFCELNSGNSNTSKQNLYNKCSTLTPESCNSTDCCVLVDGKKCIAGNAEGPYLISGKNSDYNYYLHKYNCYGEC